MHLAKCARSRPQSLTLRLIVLLAVVLTAAAHRASAQDSTAGSPIEDNSFLVEEAYNQERGVVQHINTFSRSAGSSGWTYTFTQEWPLGGQRHQVSYTLPISRTGGPDGDHVGVGDVAVNYRYQLRGAGGETVAVAPRLTVLLPTGASNRGLGTGGTGVQANLPVSARVGGALVAHSNAGITYTSRARDTFGNGAQTRAYTIGQSVIWLAHPSVNAMLEAAWSRAWTVAGPNRTERADELLVSPGVRGAIDFPSGLQIVPGVALPFGVGPSRGERRVFAYLSFEHPFAKHAP